MSALLELNRPPTSIRTTPPRKRMNLEADESFFNGEDQDEDEQPPSDLEDYNQPTPLKALSLRENDEDEDMDIMREMEAQQKEYDQSTLTRSNATSYTASNPFNNDTIDAKTSSIIEDTRQEGIKDAKGKGKMTFEEEDEFGEFGQEELGSSISKSAATNLSKQPLQPLHDYSSRYGSVHSLNLSTNHPTDLLSQGYIETLPIEVTRLDGTKVSFKRKKKLENWVNPNLQTEGLAGFSKLAANSLERPYHRLIQSLEDDALLQKKQREADETSAAFGTGLNKKNRETSEGLGEPETTMWVDRYRPKKFTDLLGDDRVHRTALAWLKEWDTCVFKGTAKANAAALMKKERRNDKKRARGDGFAGGSGNGSGGNNGGFDEAPDPYGRPREKVLLLSGPPGLGKTTLAHVLARQAGYQIHEVNASDDRTGGIVEERIRNALDSTALSLGWSKKEKKSMGVGGGGVARPTCVVIDEADGAAGGGESSFIKTLVKLVAEGSSSKRPTTRKKGKGKQDRPLLRPIIVICNDLYAPVLRPIRPLAKIIRFSAPTNQMLTKRLRTICEIEGMKAENKYLTMLVEAAEGDLRNCLTTLQMIKRRTPILDEKALQSSGVGKKDTGTSPIQVIDRLFKKPPRRKGIVVDDRYVSRIVRDVQTSGEYEKIAQGVFENYLLARDTDNESFSRISDGLEWLSFFDRLDGSLRSERNYELLAYVPFSFVPWYPLFSSQTPNPVELPKTDYEMYLQRTAHEEIATAFYNSLPIQVRSHFTETTSITELLPLFNRIVTPDLKPVNSQVVKNEEKSRMMRVVRSLIATKTSFVLDKSEDGQLSYKLDPPVDVFVHFEGKRASDIAPGRYAVRQMINREVEAELLRRGGDPEGTKKDASSILSAYKTKPAAAAIAPETKQAVDFFGRAIVPQALTATQEAAAPPRKKVKQTTYKFNEGFSNAVRTTKRVSDFFA